MTSPWDRMHWFCVDITIMSTGFWLYLPCPFCTQTLEFACAQVCATSILPSRRAHFSVCVSVIFVFRVYATHTKLHILSNNVRVVNDKTLYNVFAAFSVQGWWLYDGGNVPLRVLSSFNYFLTFSLVKPSMRWARDSIIFWRRQTHSLIHLWEYHHMWCTSHVVV